MKHYFKTAFFILIFFISINLSVKAEIVDNLYSASWPVDDQSSDVRQRAMTNAFADVLVRVSGHYSVLDNSAIKSSLSNAQDYMRQYSYKRLSAEEQLIYERPLLLVVSFDQTALLRLLKESAQPIWSENRPAGIFWIAVEESGNRYIATDSGDSVAIFAKRAAYRRGIPITLPLMDLEDESAINISDVWGRFQDPVARASKRYQTDYFVIGNLSSTGSQWQGRWSLYMGGDRNSFNTSGNTKQEAISKMVNQTADHLADKLAVTLFEQSQMLYVLVENIHDLNSYAKARNYLESLTMIKAATAIEVSSDRVLFQIESLSTTQSLIDAIEIGNNLRRSVNDTVEQQYLSFRWQD